MLVATMAALTASFRPPFVLTLGTPLVRRMLDRGQNVVNRIFGVLLLALGIRVASLERQARRTVPRTRYIAEHRGLRA